MAHNRPTPRAFPGLQNGLSRSPARCRCTNPDCKHYGGQCGRPILWAELAAYGMRCEDCWVKAQFRIFKHRGGDEPRYRLRLGR